MADVKPTIKEIETFKKTIMSLLPAATRIARKALQIKRKRKGKDDKAEPKLQPKSLDFAKWVLQQYAKFALPDGPDQHEVHFVDHAMLAQMQHSKEILQEMNNYRKVRQTKSSRGLDIGPN